MRVIQMLSTIAYGDAVSNDAMALETVIKSMNYNTRIYAESIVSPLDKKNALPIDQIGTLKDEDVVIYHFSTGSELNFRFGNLKCRKILVYHNVTPPEFFKNNDEGFMGVCQFGLDGIKYLADKVDYCIADSEFNKQDLINYGFKCKIDVLPIIIPMEDYEKKPDKKTMREMSDGKTNILFTGRVAPNKKHEDIIAAFYYYKRLYNPNSRLILAGSFKETDPYYIRLDKFVKRLGLVRDEDFIFTGHTKFNKIIAYYKCADAFLCMSEHEGFCVPVVESMIYGVPVVAYASTAVPDTMGKGTMVINDKNPVVVAGCIDKVMRDTQLRNSLIANQKERLKDFSYDKVSDMFKKYLSEFLG